MVVVLHHSCCFRDVTKPRLSFLAFFFFFFFFLAACFLFFSLLLMYYYELFALYDNYFVMLIILSFLLYILNIVCVNYYQNSYYPVCVYYFTFQKNTFTKPLNYWISIIFLILSEPSNCKNIYIHHMCDIHRLYI